MLDYKNKTILDLFSHTLHYKYFNKSVISSTNDDGQIHLNFVATLFVVKVIGDDFLAKLFYGVHANYLPLTTSFKTCGNPMYINIVTIIQI